jgi:hypothetical protein
MRLVGERFRVQGLVVRDQWSVYNIRCSRFRVDGSRVGLRSLVSGFRVQGLGFGRVACMIQNFGLRV